MAKILRIINRLNLGGPTYNVCYLSKYLAPEHETLLVSGMKDDSEESSEYIAENMGLKPIHIQHMYRAINWSNDRKAYKELVELIRHFKPDIVHTHAAKPGALGRLAAAKCKVPIVLHTFHGHVFHSYFGKTKTKVFIEIERYLAKKSTALVCLSEEQKRELTEDFKIAPAEKFHIVQLGFELDRFQQNQAQKRQQFRSQWKIADHELAIGIIGRLVPIKNHKMFLEAIRLVKNETDIPFKACIIGDGEERQQIENLTDLMQLRDKIIFTSWAKQVDIELNGLDIVTLTSFNEGTPVSMIEAQAAGKPVISTRVGGVQNVIRESESGFLVESDNPRQLADRLKMLMQDAELRSRFGKAGVRQAFDNFSVHSLVHNMNALYHRLL